MKKLFFLAIAALFIAPAAVAGTAAGIDAFNAKKFDVAIKELTPAAEAGEPEALYYLAQIYSGGFGVQKNAAKALELYGRAANKGHVLSQREYGTALAIGDGAEQDVIEGLKWLFIAARSGDQSAGVYALRFSQLMNRTVVLKARRNASEWMTAFRKSHEGGRY